MAYQGIQHDMTWNVIAGDWLDGLRQLPDESVHCVVTSPPYWGLRDYGVEGQLGLERTPEEYVARMVAGFREIRRVLRADGVVWLNLGDSYAATSKGSGGTNSKQPTNAGSFYNFQSDLSGLKPKDLVGIPWRVAFALQADGWWLRSEVIWAKPNPMPESVRDRPTKAHEQVFLLTKAARYWYDAEAVKEPNQWKGDIDKHAGKRITYSAKYDGSNGTQQAFQSLSHTGRNRRSVWTITPRPYSGAHFATMPIDLAEICIKAGTSERGVCPVCGAQWARVVEKGLTGVNERRPDNGMPGRTGAGLTRQRAGNPRVETLGWRPSCDHDAAPVPATVLDPFAGAGTTLLAAVQLGRHAVGIELNPDYIDLIAERMSKAKVARQEALL